VVAVRARAHALRIALGRSRFRVKAKQNDRISSGGRPMKTVFIYVNTSKRFGDPDHLKVFANVDAAETWFEENDPEGVAFEYEVME
jgi:hypothetical protein